MMIAHALSLFALVAAQAEAARSSDDGLLQNSQMIPPAFQGKWASSLAACSEPADEGIIEIETKDIWGWEWVWEVMAITPTDTPGSVRVEKRDISPPDESPGSDATVQPHTTEIWTLTPQGDRLTMAGLDEDGDGEPDTGLETWFRCKQAAAHRPM